MAENHTKLTTNASEVDLGTLISKCDIFAIPFFQRPYKWKPQRLRQFEEDLEDLVGGLNDFHFLGAIITHERKLDPSLPKEVEVIDGQQRLTTVYLYLCAIFKELCQAKKLPEAKQLFFNRLVFKRDVETSNIRLHPCKEDRAQLNWVFEQLLSTDNFAQCLGKFSPKLLLTSEASKSGQLRKNFQRACQYIHYARSKGGIKKVRSIRDAILNQMSVVRLELSDPMNGPKIFDSLNSRQEPMTIGELVRNEIFARVADKSPTTSDLIDRSFWQPFYEKFQQKKNLFDGYFFPFGLIQNPNVKKSDVYADLRKKWGKDKDPKSIIQGLASFQDAYIDIETGSNSCSHPKRLAAAFQRLYEAGSPSSVLPFLMQLSVAVSRGKVKPMTAVGILEIIESFLVRRAVCGDEPTGLHAVFKRLWKDCGPNITPAKVKQIIAKHKTVSWPNDEAFASAIRSRPLYGAGITKYLVLQFDKGLGGDNPTDSFHIEHILPNTLSANWRNSFSREEHDEFKDVLGNLLLLHGPMNVALGNKPFGVKVKRYANDSMFKSPRAFAARFKRWTPKDLNRRAVQLSRWAIKRWPHTR